MGSEMCIRDRYSEGKIGQLRTTSVMDFTQIKEGIRAAQSGEAAKVVIAPNPSNMVPVVPRPLRPCRFDPCASYVLAGGYGGLGRSLARWMASRGATNLIILSRSSASSPEKVELIADLDKMGCKVHSLACDVADISSLQQLSGDDFSNLPPIKGCIQGSMVLRVSHHTPLFTRYTPTNTLLGRRLRGSLLRRLASSHQTKSPRLLEPAYSPTRQHGLLHHALLSGRDIRQPRTIKLCRRQHLPRRTGRIPRLERHAGRQYKPRQCI